MVLRYQLYFAVLFLSTVFSWQTVGKKYGWIPAILLAWILISAGLYFQNPQYTYDPMDIKLRLVSARSFVLVTMLIYFMTKVETRLIPFMVKCFEVVMVANSIVYMTNGYGVFNAGSMDMAFNAMVYPLLVFRPMYAGTMGEIYWRGTVASVPFICLFFNVPGSTVFFDLAIGLGTFLILKMKWRSLPVLIGALPLILMFGYFRESQGFLSDSNRIRPWKLFLTTWWNEVNIWFGSGTGTFQWLGPATQIKNNETELFTVAHNEYLQIAYEQGIVGFVLAGILLVICLRKARDCAWLLSSCFATMFVAFVQYPLRFFLSQIFILLLIRLCLDDESRRMINNP